MPGSIFNLDDDLRSFLLRATASLERVDGAVAEFQQLTQRVNRIAVILEGQLEAMERARKAMSE